ncbi:MAG: hypothetical protein IPO22_14595 [Anaerolineales bacterium]|nr:hypothetical protein [Anaerolineales bacterium]
MCNTDENPEKEELYLNLLYDENVAGVIFSPPSNSALLQFLRCKDAIRHHRPRPRK